MGTLDVVKSWTEIKLGKKKEIKNIVNIRKNDFNDILKLSLRIWEKLKTLKSKKSGLTVTNIFEKSGIAKVNRYKRCIILRKLLKEMK